jgi:hypothetical protein
VHVANRRPTGPTPAFILGLYWLDDISIVNTCIKKPIKKILLLIFPLLVVVQGGARRGGGADQD